MKDRFYGDVNDFIKYGVLALLVKKYKRPGVNWYLTDDKQGNPNDGNKLQYLKNKKWEKCNQRIFQLLKSRISANTRDVRYCRQDHVIDFIAEHTVQLPNTANNYVQLRSNWHTTASAQLRDCDFVFIDPDKGVIDSLPSNHTKASEYCTTQEITSYKNADWLVVQFPKRAARYSDLINNPVVQIAMQSKKKVTAFIWGQMALLYISEVAGHSLIHEIYIKWGVKIFSIILVP